MSSIVADEVRQFAAHAGDWWDPNGSEAMLHKLNPVRLKYIRDQIDQHWQCDELLILSTPNATGWSKLLMITIGEGLGRIPKGTHDFDKFIGPERMKQLLADAGLKCIDVEGIAWSPTRGLHLSDDVRLNYLVSAIGLSDSQLASLQERPALNRH